MALNKFINKPSPLIRSICCLPTLDASSRARTISRNTAFENAYVIYFFKWHFGGCLTNTSASLCSAVKHPPNNSLKLGKKTKLKAERRKRDSPFSGNGRVYSHSGAWNGEFGGIAARNHILIARESLF